MISVIYLIRHATPDWSRTDLRYDVPPGPPLTAHGENEAVKLGEFLRTADVARIYASPLERTQRTAQIAATAVGAPVIEEAAIAEWRRDESESAVLERISRFWELAWAESKQSGPLAVISHGGPIRILLQHLGLGRDEIDFYRKQFDRDNPLPPAGAWQATRNGSRQEWQLHLAFTPQPHQMFAREIVFV